MKNIFTGGRRRFARWLFCLSLMAAFSPAFAQKLKNPQQRPRPSDAQMAWHEMGFYLFFHFGPNTFTNVEWGKGTEPESVFNPTSLDCDQWCRIARASGAKGVIITAKHHDGFCLWPSHYSRHTVRESPWKNGKGDVLRELADACRRHGLKLGVYLSPWDRNHRAYGTPEYNDVYANTLTELLTNYGPLFEIWWDGANGEGPNGKKQAYDFHRFEKLVRKYQPDAVIFSDIGPGCRWAGNENGTIGEPNWCMIDTAGFKRGAGAPSTDVLQHGLPNGSMWIPAECDVSIRPGWFFHPEEDSLVKTPEQLLAIYLQSVGRGANLILNVPPNRKGLISDADSASLVGLGNRLRAFEHNLAFKKPCFMPGPHRNIPASALVDGNDATSLKFFMPPPGGPAPEFVLDFQQETSFNCIRLTENIRKSGQRVKHFSVEKYDNGKWTQILDSQTIGARKILRFPEVKTTKIRVKILDAFEYCEPAEVQVFHLDLDD